MNNVATTLVRVAVLAGGAALGALLARMFDQMISSHAEEQPDYHKTRYAEGLGPIVIEPTIEQSQSE